MKKILVILVMLLTVCAPANAIKIGLQDGVYETRVGGNKAGYVIDKKTGAILYRTEAKIAYKIFPYKNVLGIEIKGHNYKLNTNAAIIRNSTNDGFVYAKRKWYRGEIIIYNVNGQLIVINDVPLEDYIMGVVPSEMPSRWNIEAHRAQAIAARSYALSNLGKRAKRGYDLLDTPMDQAYGGASAETFQTNRAVSSTRGIVMTYNNKIITAYYHASSGGHTKSSGDVWTKNLPYLKSVEGYDFGKKKFGHGVGMSQYGANNLANKGYGGFQILNHFYNNISFARVKEVSLSKL